MVIFLCDLYISVWVPYFWGPCLNMLYQKLSYNECCYKQIPEYLVYLTPFSTIPKKWNKYIRLPPCDVIVQKESISCVANRANLEQMPHFAASDLSVTLL